MKDEDKHKFAATGNQFQVVARSPATVAYVKELLDRAMRIVERSRRQKKKKK